MIPTSSLVKALVAGILHVCGDDPLDLTSFDPTDMYSPRMWR